jgi:hypothetical protein
MMNRRQFSSLALLGVVSAWFGSVAASCGSIYAQIAAYVGVGIQAFQAVVNLLSGAGIIALPEGTLITAILTLVKAGWADVQAAIAAYNAAPATTLAGKISAALTAVQMMIQQFWSDVKIPDAALSSTVAGLLGLIVSTIAGFLAALPPAPAPAAAKPLVKTLNITPVKLTVPQFRTKFNAILTAGGHSAYVI